MVEVYRVLIALPESQFVMDHSFQAGFHVSNVLPMCYFFTSAILLGNLVLWPKLVVKVFKVILGYIHAEAPIGCNMMCSLVCRFVCHFVLIVRYNREESSRKHVS